LHQNPAKLVSQLDAPFVIWLNPFWGTVADGGKTFEQMRTYEEIRSKVETVVSLPAFTDELFPKDIVSMLGFRQQVDNYGTRSITAPLLLGTR
jgi:hypothetical protein